MNNEENLQQAAERGQFDAHNPDDRAYKIVFRALEREPASGLSADFASRVIAAQRKDARFWQSDQFWLWLGVSVFVLTGIVLVLALNVQINLGVLRFVTTYRGLFIFGGAFILLLQWVERRLGLKHTP